MKSILALIAGLGLVTSAFADVRFYFTNSADEAGLTNPALAFSNTDGNGTDGSSYALTGAAPKVSTPFVEPQNGQWLYLWVAFEDEPNNRKIQGINLSINAEDHEVARGIYLGDDSNGDEGGSVRWNLGSQTDDPLVLVAIQEPGIVNRSADRWLYDGGTRTALLGALQFEYGQKGSYEVRLGLERQGVSYSGQKAPMVKLGSNNEQFDGSVLPEGTQVRWSTDPDAKIDGVPEPASILLLALAALAVRPRTARN